MKLSWRRNPIALPRLRVLLLAPRPVASAQVLDRVFAGLAQQGALEYRVLYENEASFLQQRAAVEQADILFLFRSCAPDALALLRLAKGRGKLVVYSTDEDLRTCDPARPLRGAVYQPEARAEYAAVIREADLLWLFSTELRCRYQAFHNRIVVGQLPSFVEVNFPNDRKVLEAEDEQPCVIGCNGTYVQEIDWRPLVQPLLQVLDRYRHVQVEVIGSVVEEVAAHPRVRVLPAGEDLEMHHAFLRQAHWSIGLAPLADTFFNRGKTNVAYCEYAGAGIPGIYSDLPVYADCVRHEETGYLTAHSEEGFAAALRAMIERPALRAKIRRGALQDAASTYALRRVQLHLLREISLLAIRRGYKGWKKPTLLVVGFAGASSTHIDALQPCRQLQEQGFLRFAWVQPDEVTAQHFTGIDGVYVVRAFQPDTLRVLRHARRNRIPVVSSWDDDFLSIPAGTPLGNYYRDRPVVRAIKKFLRQSALVIASTPPLVERSRAFTDQVLESIDGLDAVGLTTSAEEKPPPEPADGKIRIGFYGVNTGIGEPWLAEALQELRERYGSRVILEVIGTRLPSGLRHVIDWHSERLLPYAESLHLLRSRCWDIGLAPLADTPFNAAKQATKFRDYAWAGAAIVCSRVPAYERVLIDGIHGLFAENTAAAWMEALSSLIDDPAYADFLRRGASMLLQTVHSQEITNATWQQLIWRIGAARESRGVFSHLWDWRKRRGVADSLPRLTTNSGQHHKHMTPIVYRPRTNRLSTGGFRGLHTRAFCGLLFQE